MTNTSLGAEVNDNACVVSYTFGDRLFLGELVFCWLFQDDFSFIGFNKTLVKDNLIEIVTTSKC